MKRFLRAVILALFIAFPVAAATQTLSASGHALTLGPLYNASSIGYSLAAGIVGTVTPEFSFDGTVYTSDLANPPIILPLVGNSISGTLAVPAGAVYARLRVSSFTSGSTLATMNPALAGGGVSRAYASGALAAATATVITAGAAQTATGNFVAIPVDPTKWASAVFTFTSAAFSGTLVWDVMIDGQWVTGVFLTATQPAAGAPYAALTSTASGSPSTAGSVTYTTTAADTWEMPLPGNVTQVRVRCSAFTSGSVTVTLAPGRPLVPGVPVIAVLADVTTAVNTAGDTGIVNAAGWSGLTALLRGSGAAQGVAQFLIKSIDDAGSSFAADSYYTPASADGIGFRVAFGGSVSASFTSSDTTSIGMGFAPKRLLIGSVQTASLSGRIRIEVRR